MGKQGCMRYSSRDGEVWRPHNGVVERGAGCGMKSGKTPQD